MKTFEKDPEAVLDYEWDWTDWLGTDTIENATVVVSSGEVVVDSVVVTAGKVTAWISAGNINETTIVTCTITTGEGRIDERSIKFNMKDR